MPTKLTIQHLNPQHGTFERVVGESVDDVARRLNTSEGRWGTFTLAEGRHMFAIKAGDVVGVRDAEMND